jgi:hypothetical protein
MQIFGLPPHVDNPDGPADYYNSMPRSVKARLGDTYQIVFTVEDPESGVEYVRVDRDAGWATCSPSFTPGPQTLDRFRYVDAGNSFYPSPSARPTTFPSTRSLSIDMPMNIHGGCPARDTLKMTGMIWLTDARNGAGLKAKIVAFSDVTYLGVTNFEVRYP